MAHLAVRARSYLDSDKPGLVQQLTNETSSFPFPYNARGRQCLAQRPSPPVEVSDKLQNDTHGNLDLNSLFFRSDTAYSLEVSTAVLGELGLPISRV